jgi:hypothetical protein
MKQHFIGFSGGLGVNFWITKQGGPSLKLHLYRNISMLVVLFLVSIVTSDASEKQTRASELDELVNPAEKKFLLTELARVQPPERLRELSKYGQRQLDLGGGFYGMLPDQLTDPDSIPLPADEIGCIEAALGLAKQRSTNITALQQINPDYTLAFRGEPLPDFVDRITPELPKLVQLPDGLKLILDVSALTGFFEALEDGEVSTDEASALAALPSNQAMLEHRRNLGYVPEPLPDTESLAAMIRMAGSTDPADRLWCWINPQNAFGYADLVSNAIDYIQFLSELESHKDRLAEKVLRQIGPYTSRDSHSAVRFAFTVGWAIQGWATPDMVGLNIEQTKDDWNRLFQTLVEETYHRLQLEMCPTPTGEPAHDFSDLVAIETGDPGYDRLYEIITYCVLEGAANRACGRFADADLADKVPAGAELMARFVNQVVEEGAVESADALITEGLKGNGPLYGLGWKLASLIAEQDGEQAIGEYQQKGPVRFFLYGATLAADSGEPLLTSEVTTTVGTLEKYLDRRW